VPVDQKNVALFTSFFTGLTQSYVTFTPTPNGEGKVSGDYKRITKPIAEEHYAAHLEGGVGLCVVPINERSLARFGAIDIDDYNPVTRTRVLRTIYRHNLPLLPFVSKSGGLHLYTYCMQGSHYLE